MIRQMQASPQMQNRLLELASLDAEIKRAKYQRDHLTINAEIEAARADIQTKRDEAARISMVVEDLDRDIARIEGDIAAIRKREEHDTKLLEGGTMTAKQQSEMMHELSGLQRRRSVLEDEEIAVMEQREATEQDVTRTQQAVEQAQQQVDELTAQQEKQVAQIADTAEKATRQWAQASAEIDPELLKIYVSQRESGRPGAGALSGRICGGCRMELNASEATDAWQAPVDQVVQCSECGAVLIRKDR